MPTGHPIPIDALHRVLWVRSDRLGRVRINQKQLAEELGHSHYAICRAIKRMEEQERLRKVGGRSKNTYMIIIDPEVWDAAHHGSKDDWLG